MTEASKVREFWIDEGANGFDLGFVRRWVAEFPHKDSLVDQEHIHVIEKSFADKLQSENETFKTREIAHLVLIQDLQFQLADRSEKYRIAMDKGVDILADRVKQKDELLRECEEALDQSLRQWEMYANFSEEDLEDRENTEAMLFKAYAKTLGKLREGKG